MPCSIPRFASLGCVVALVALAAACHRQAPAAASPVEAASETSCWWTVYRTELPLDTVAAHLASAFDTLGLADAAWVRRGDTAWAKAGPTRLPSRFGGTFSARAVAFQRGELTLYRYFVTASPPPGGWHKGYDSVTVNNTHISVIPASSAIGLCASIASAAHNEGRAPKSPNGEELLAIWSSRPASYDAPAPVAAPAPAPVTIGYAVTTIAPVPMLVAATADSIVLERTPCFGVCPAYRVRIARSGAVLYQSRATGDTTRTAGSVSAEAAQRVFERADRLRFTALPDTIAQSPAYCGIAPTDFPSAITTIFAGQQSKHVVDYEGCDWAPVGLRRLEMLIDSVAGTQRLLRPRFIR